MFTSVSERQLARRLSAGELDALPLLYEREMAELREICQSISGDPVQAADAAETAFYRAVEQLADESVSPAGFHTAVVSQARALSYEARIQSSYGEHAALHEPIDRSGLLLRFAEAAEIEPEREPQAPPPRRRIPAAAPFVAVAAALIVSISVNASTGHSVAPAKARTARAAPVKLVALAPPADAGAAARMEQDVRAVGPSAQSAWQAHQDALLQLRIARAQAKAAAAKAKRLAAKRRAPKPQTKHHQASRPAHPNRHKGTSGNDQTGHQPSGGAQQPTGGGPTQSP